MVFENVAVYKVAEPAYVIAYIIMHDFVCFLKKGIYGRRVLPSPERARPSHWEGTLGSLIDRNRIFHLPFVK